MRSDRPGCRSPPAWTFGATTHHQVERAWRVDFSDRGSRRPALSIRRLSATLHYRRLTVDAGNSSAGAKPTSSRRPIVSRRAISSTSWTPSFSRHRRAGGRSGGQRDVRGSDCSSLHASRVPLVDQRWTAVPPQAAGIRLVDGGRAFPPGRKRASAGPTWAPGYEYSFSFFDGFNHLPNIEAHARAVGSRRARVEPRLSAIKSFGADAAVPPRWFTVKGGRLLHLVHAGDRRVRALRPAARTADGRISAGWRDTPGSQIHKAARTADLRARPAEADEVGRRPRVLHDRREPQRSARGAVRQNGHGGYVKAEYSQARGQHWRMTVTGSVIAGRVNDFLGQYRRNSHLSAALHYSF